MKICDGCHRHLLGSEPVCPFCGHALPMVTSKLRRCGQIVMVGVSIVLGSMGCDPGEVLETGGASAGTEAPTTESGSDSATTDPTSSSGGTQGGTGMVMTTSEGTDAVESSDGPDNSDDGAGSFYAGAPDGGAIDFECDIFAQDCEKGEKCMPWANDGSSSWNATHCTPIAEDPDQVGEPCTVEGSGTSGFDSCDIGLMCWGVDEDTNEGICEDMCQGDEAAPICEDPDDACSITNDGALILCLPTCDPVMQDCADGLGCFPVDEDFFCVNAGAPEAVPGDSCGFINDCAPGMACVDGAGYPGCEFDSCCSPFCDVTDLESDTDCADLAAGQECFPWFEEGEAPANYEHVGVCFVPA